MSLFTRIADYASSITTKVADYILRPEISALKGEGIVVERAGRNSMVKYLGKQDCEGRMRFPDNFAQRVSEIYRN